MRADATGAEGARRRGVAPSLAATIREIGGGPKSARDLDVERACALFAAMLAGDVPPLEMGAILIALRIKGESLAETIGFMRALDACVGRIDPPAEAPRPVVLPSYGGARRRPNLTPLLALLLRRYGVPVLVHGPGSGEAESGAVAETRNDGDGATGNAGGRVTTRDILCELGIAPARSLADATRSLAQQGIAYVPTGVLAPRLAPLLGLKARLGVRSCAHSLVKLIDPFAGGGYRVVAVTHPHYLRLMRDFLIATQGRALLLRGTEGEPYADPRRQVQLESFAEGVATICAEKEAGSVVELPDLPDRIDADATAQWIEAALSGARPVPAPIVAQLACCLEGTRRARAPLA